jgi:uncharacterized membrane protein YbhN (UPF0104 family)
VVGAVVLNVVFQLLLTWRQFNTIAEARPLLVIAAILNQVVAYGVIVPAMGRFYERCGIYLSSWRAFALVGAGLAASRVFPSGEYFVWRMSLARHRGGVASTTQWFIMYSVGMFVALAGLFLLFEVLSIVLYPYAHMESVVESLRYIPMLVGAAVVMSVLALRIPRFRRWVAKLAFGQVSKHSFSPQGIIRDRGLDWRDLSWLVFASVGSWMIEGYTLYLCMAALGMHVPFVLAICGYCFARLIANMPLSPGGIGEMEAASVLFFATYGLPVELVITALLLHRLITYWPPIAIGVALMCWPADTAPGSLLYR